MEKLFPKETDDQSDSACLDNTLEYLLLGGRSHPHSMMMLNTEPWEANSQLDLDRRGFFQYHSAMM
jgi:glutamate synthase domain-containing protein 1